MSALPGDEKTLGIVIGASSGVGLAVVRRLARRGAVIAAARRAAEIDGDVTFLACDIRDYEQVRNVMRAVGGRPLDFIINCAGVGYFAPLGKNGTREWSEIVETNIVGLLIVLSSFLEEGIVASRFVQVGSLASRYPSTTPGNIAYTASKAAALPILEEFRRELKTRHIDTRVSLVSPGYIRGTDFGRNFFRASPDSGFDLFGEVASFTPEVVAEEIERILDSPLGMEHEEVILRPC